MALKLGSTTLTALYLGSTAISTAYLGSTEVYAAGGAFSPLSLFASGEEGAWYEPSTSTAFLSTTDLTPCAYGGPDGCGFLLDKSQGAGYSGGSFTGLGSELVTNGTFNTDISGWITTDWTWDASQRAALNTTTNILTLKQNLGLSIGTVVLISFDYEVVTGSGQIGAEATNSANVLFGVGSGTKTFVWTVPATGSTIFFRNLTATTEMYIDNISVRELPGNHATQVTAGARPILARVPEGGRRNLLIYSEDQSNAIWTKTGVSLSGSETDPLGGAEAEKLTPSATSTTHRTINNQTYTASVGQGVVHSCYVKAAGYSKVALRESAATGAYASFDLATESVLDTGNAGSIVVSGATITNVGSGWYRISMVCTNASGAQANGFALWFLSPAYTTGSPTTSWAGDGTSGMLVWGAQLEAGSTATAYQRVVDEYDITEAGVTSLEYLSFDGADDFMDTGVDTNVFLPGAGYLVVGGANFASVGGSAQAYQRKAFCGDQSGYFGMWAHSLNGGEAGVYHWDTTIKTAEKPYIVGNNAVFTGRRDGSIGVSGEIYASVDGVSSTGTAAGGLSSLAGGFVIGEQFGIHFDGNLYGLIVRGASSTTGEITNTEAYLATRSGVTL